MSLLCKFRTEFQSDKARVCELLNSVGIDLFISYPESPDTPIAVEWFEFEVSSKESFDHILPVIKNAIDTDERFADLHRVVQTMRFKTDDTDWSTPEMD